MAPTGSPSFNKREAETSVVLLNNQTLVLGGLIQDKVTVNDRGIPFFKNIPLIGYLFGFKERAVERTELLMLITPKVVGTALDAARDHGRDAARDPGAQQRGQLVAAPAALGPAVDDPAGAAADPAPPPPGAPSSVVPPSDPTINVPLATPPPPPPVMPTLPPTAEPAPVPQAVPPPAPQVVPAPAASSDPGATASGSAGTPLVDHAR